MSSAPIFAHIPQTIVLGEFIPSIWEMTDHLTMAQEDTIDQLHGVVQQHIEQLWEMKKDYASSQNFFREALAIDNASPISESASINHGRKTLEQFSASHEKLAKTLSHIHQELCYAKKVIHDYAIELHQSLTSINDSCSQPTTTEEEKNELLALAAQNVQQAFDDAHPHYQHYHDILQTSMLELHSIHDLYALSATTHNPYSGDYSLIQEPESGYDFLIDAIEHAHKHVTMTMYELADPQVVAALIDAHKHGVKVELLLDQAYHGKMVNHTAYNQLLQAGVDVQYAPSNAIFHQKTVTVDDSVSFVGTGNLQRQYYNSSRDGWIVDKNQRDVSAIEQTFANDKKARSGTGESVAGDRLLWSPHAREEFIATIDSAQHTINLTSEEFKDPQIIDAISRAAQRGVDCRIIVTQNKNWTAALTTVEEAGAHVHTLPKNKHTVYMHEKEILVDDDKLIIGSQNLGTYSLTRNRELSLNLSHSDAPDLFDSVKQTFENDYNIGNMSTDFT